ncbi:cysteine hydrolase family protein [Cellulomonas phragmiteti]|uniref:Peroxyureidoacrylate/ureidoacrylate amidohydrolase RutB n=1 Tax=Cellulomonas phragmiteti TaxID=478780 RepID=A0ABQ4DLM4_9CELL|nr:isochorismatase family cysteine hydrolase [Cellulomonas phragmiteti]GIG40243.1 peroxyureidoacrylate/ureidoacrylate amidohydrolase RutB [Cellulomonas phragmiteti]
MTYPTPRFAPGTAAVVVVDVQNDFCDPAGACAQRGSDVTGAVAMVPRLEAFLDAARAAGVLVVFIQTTHDETTNSPAWLARRGDPVEGGPTPVATCATGTWGAEFYRVAPQPGEPVVIKHRYSAFAGTNLDVVLRSAGIDSLLLTGVSTNVCVESTLRDGLFAEYRVTLVEDCAASFEEDAHAATVANVEKYFGVVATSEEIGATWSTLSRAA